MNQEPRVGEPAMTNERFGRQPFSWLAPIGGAIAAAMGIVALLGWALGMPRLAGLTTHQVPMAGTTALLFLLYGIAIVLRARAPLSRRVQWTSTILAASGTVLTLAFLLLSTFDLRIRAAQWGFPASESFPGMRIGFISPVVVFCFALVSLSFFASLPSRAIHSWRAVAAWWIAALLLAACSVFLLAYLYGAPLLYSGPAMPPALTTLVALVALGIASLGLAGPQAWPRGEPAESATRASYVLALVFVALAVGIVAAGYFYYRHYEENFRIQVERELSSVAELKRDELVQWRNERLGDGVVFQKNAAFTNLARRYLNEPEEPEPQEQLSAWLGQVEAAYWYDRVLLLDAQGVERMSVPQAPTPVAPFVLPNAAEILRSGQVVFRDFYKDEHNEHLYLSVLVPIFDEQNDNRDGFVLENSRSPRQKAL